MAKHTELEILDKAIEITVAAVGGAGEKSAHIISNSNQTADFMQAVYDKLKEINDSLG